jgi:hypothetical protein
MEAMSDKKITAAPEVKQEEPPMSDLEKVGIAFQKIGRVLATLPDDAARGRVIRAVGILYGVELEPKP